MGAAASAHRLLIALGATVVVCALGAASARAEIFDGSGFQAISWNMHVGDVEQVIGNGVSRLRNRHSDYAYLRAASYQYLGCQYELLMKFEAKGGTLSSIILTHPGGAKAGAATSRAGRGCHVSGRRSEPRCRYLAAFNVAVEGYRRQRHGRPSR